MLIHVHDRSRSPHYLRRARGSKVTWTLWGTLSWLLPRRSAGSCECRRGCRWRNHPEIQSLFWRTFPIFARSRSILATHRVWAKRKTLSADRALLCLTLMTLVLVQNHSLNHRLSASYCNVRIGKAKYSYSMLNRRLCGFHIWFLPVCLSVRLQRWTHSHVVLT